MLPSLGSRGLVGIRQEYFHWQVTESHMGFPGGSDGKESVCNAEDPGWIPGSGRYPGEVNGYPLQYSCLENSRQKNWTEEPGGLQSMVSQRVGHN